MPVVGAFLAGSFGWGATAAVATSSTLASAWVAGTTVGTFITSTIAGRLLASVALSALSAALQKRPSPQLGGIRTSRTQTGGVTPASFVLGERYATEGQLVAPPMSHAYPGGRPNDYLTYVIELGDLPGQTLEKVFIDGAEVTLGSTPHADYGLPMEGIHAGYGWVKYYDGSQTAADPMLLAKYPAPLVRPWSADMVGAGIPYAILTFRFNRQVYNGFPAARFEVGGIPLYDPRKDSTAGGAGSHRWNDKATWEPTGNNIVVTYNIMRGIDLGGGNIWGGGFDAEDLPLDSWFAGMNACDVAVSLSGGGTEPRFRCGFEVFVDEEPAEVIDELLKGANAEITEVGGYWKVRVGGPGLPVYFFTDDEVVISKPQELDPFPGLSDTYNAIHASYPEPDEVWQTKDAPPRYDAAFEDEDGGRRLVADLSLPSVPFRRQVQRVMRAYIREERRFRRHTLTLPPEADILEPLDAASWTSAHNQYTAKVFELASVVDDVVNGNPTVSLKERDSSDHDWTPGDELPTSVAPVTIETPVSVAVPGFDALPATIKDAADADRRPAIRLIWNAALAEARGLKWQVRLAATQEEVSRGSTQDVEAASLIISEGILPATDYEARARLVTRLPSQWTGWEPVTTGAIKLQPVDLDDSLSSVATPANLATSTSLIQDGVALVVATWDASTNAKAYEVGITRTGGNEVVLVTGETRYEFESQPGIGYSIRVRAVPAIGAKSAWSAAEPVTAAVDNTAPAAPTGLTTTSGLASIWLKWDANAESDLAFYEVCFREVAGTPGANPPEDEIIKSLSTKVLHSGLEGAKTYYYHVRAVDTSGNASPWSAQASGSTYNIVAVDPPENLQLSTQLVSDGVAKIIATWDASAHAAHYQVAITQSGGNEVTLVTGETRYEFESLPGISYSIRVRAVNGLGDKSLYTDPEPITAAVDNVAPAVPTGLGVTPGFGTFWVEWTGVGDGDLSHYELTYKASATTPGVNPTSPIIETASTKVSLSGFDGDVTRYFWVRAVDSSGNKSGWSASANATTVSPEGAITTEDLEGLIDATSFANNVAPVEIVASLPTEGNFEGRTAVLTSDGKLYRYVGGAWTANISAEDLSGQIGPTQIEDGAVTARKMVIGDFTNLYLNELHQDEGYLSGQFEYVDAPNENFLSDRILRVEAAAGAWGVATASDHIFTVDPLGEEFWYFFTASIENGATGYATLQIQVNTEADFSGTSDFISANISTTSVSERTGTFEVPAGFRYGRIRLLKSNSGDNTRANFGFVAVRRKNAGKLLVDGDIKANHLFTDAVTAGTIAAGAVNTRELAFGAATGSRLAITDLTNLNKDKDFSDDDAWTHTGVGTMTFVEAANQSNWDGKNYLKLTGTGGEFVQVTGEPFDVDIDGEKFWVKGRGYAPAGNGTGAIALEAATDDTWATRQTFWGGLTFDQTSITRMSGEIEIPAGYRYARLRIYKSSDGNTDARFGGIEVRRKGRGELLVDGTIKANHLDTVDAVITGTAQIANSVITTAHIDELDAGVLEAGTALAGSITVNNTALQDVETRAEDPAARINNKATQIDPGKITIWGGNLGQLSDWRLGGDWTTINGGAIGANTIAANKLTIGNRGISVQNIQFEADAPNVEWTSGAVRYPGDGGASTSRSVAAGSAAYAGSRLYIYFTKGQQDLSVSTDADVAGTGDNVILATYGGGTDLTVNYGQTVIDGDHIKTGSVKANHLDTVDAVITGTAQIANSVITTAHIDELDAGVLEADTTISNTIKVDGTALQDINSRSENPAARINQKATTIDPGKILIQGATTLSDWRKGGDLTKIDGGALSANTVDANKLTIGNRGVSVQNVQFEANSPGNNQVSWTGGGVRYVGDDGTSSFRSVAAGNATHSGSRLYIYFTKGSTDFSVSTDATVAGTGDNIIVATYAGGTDLTVNFGQTIIDGDHIKTGTVQATHISVTSLDAISADLGTIEVDTANIANLAVTTLKINDVAVERDKLEDNAASDGGQTYEAGGEIASNGGTDIVIMSQAFGAINANQPLTFAASCEVRGQASPANGVRPRAWYRLSDSDSWVLFSDPGSYHTGTTFQGFGNIIQGIFDADNFQIRITLLNQQPVGNITQNNVRRKMIYARSLQR